MIIQAKGIRKNYGNLEVLRGVDFDAEEAEIISITGASGAGKSTLLHMLGTLDQPDQGEIRLAGKVLSELKGDELARFRNRNIGFVFQFHHLLPEFTSLENVMIPALLAGVSRETAREKAMLLLNRMGLQDRAEHKPEALSGGEQQRVAVARALINQPKVLLADEPSGNLDSVNALNLHELFMELARELRQTIVIVTHDQQLAAIADRSLVMKDGKII